MDRTRPKVVQAINGEIVEDTAPEWLTAVHVRAQAKMLSSLLGQYRSDMPSHVRDDIMESATKRARLMLEMLERGDGREL